MQKIFHFELGMAFKDRPKSFQVIILVLFAFSLTMVLFGAIARMTDTVSSHQVLQNKQENRYASITGALPAAMPLTR